MPEAHVFYRKEMFLGEQLQIGVRSVKLKRSSWVMEYRIEREGQLTAEGETPLVCFNYHTRKPCRIPSEFHAALVVFEGL
jgi:acyl-CoA thioesterase FadM